MQSNAMHACHACPSDLVRGCDSNLQPFLQGPACDCPNNIISLNPRDNDLRDAHDTYEVTQLLNRFCDGWWGGRPLTLVSWVHLMSAPQTTYNVAVVLLTLRCGFLVQDDCSSEKSKRAKSCRVSQQALIACLGGPEAEGCSMYHHPYSLPYGVLETSWHDNKACNKAEHKTPRGSATGHT